MTDATQHDFIDGRGPVPAHHHANGGGWVADTAHVDATAYVGPDARVFGQARVCDQAHVYGKALVYGAAHVYGGALVYGEAHVGGQARVSRTPIVVTGGEYVVMICDAHVCVGCQVATLEEWAAGFAPEACPRLEAMRAGLLAIARAHMAPRT